VFNDKVEGCGSRFKFMKMFKFRVHDFETRPLFNNVLLLWFNAYVYDKCLRISFMVEA